MERNRRIQATSFALPKRRNHDNIAQPSWASRGLSRPREHRPPASPARGDTTWPRCFAGAVFMAEIVILSAAYLGSLEFCLRVSSWHLHERFRAGTDLFRKACEFRHSLANVCARLMDGRSNLTNFGAIQRLRGDVSDMTQSAAQSGQGIQSSVASGGCINSINRWKTQVKDFFKQIVTLFKLRVTLKPYRQAVRRQRADEARISSPHIRHFGLRHRPRFARDM
jgi:hypothetical protein